MVATALLVALASVHGHADGPGRMLCRRSWLENRGRSDGRLWVPPMKDSTEQVFRYALTLPFLLLKSFCVQNYSTGARKTGCFEESVFRRE